MKIEHLFSLLFGLFSAVAIQAQFINATNALPASVVLQTNSYGSGISFYDFNGDGWDDLSMGNSTGAPHFFVNNQGILEPASFTIPNLNGAAVVALLWADVDNDSDPDIFITKEYGKPELWINNGSFSFSNELEASGIEGGTQRYMGAALCDYDHDGFLDLYVSIYSHPSTQQPNEHSKFYKNNGDGTFTDFTQQSGLTLPPLPIFQPVFADVNGDGWEDLYLIIDRVEFRNELFLNNGNGTFSNVSAGSGSDVYVCSMTGTVGDYDNDGDLDVYVSSNPTTGNVLLKNEGDNNFTEIASQMGVVVNSYCWGSLWLDYDNDSWQDLYVGATMDMSPSLSFFYRNEDGSNFIDFSFGSNLNQSENKSYVCAKGDLNSDGYYDFATVNRSPVTSKLFMNDGGTNNFLSVSVKGTYSNPDGIGTWIKCYADGNEYVRYTLCGENFFAQDSGKNIFGLGSSSTVDSLVIYWNRGLVETYYNIAVNQHLVYYEGASLTQPFDIASTSTTLCSGDSLELFAVNGQSYLWNTGETSQSIYVDQPGTYSVTVYHPFNYSAQSFPLEIIQAPEVNIIQQIQSVSCHGMSNGSAVITVENTPSWSILWADGNTNPYILEMPEGNYGYIITDNYECNHAGAVLITQPDSLSAQHNTHDVSCFEGNDGSVMLEIQGGTPPVEVIWIGYNPMALAAGNYAYMLVDNNECNLLGSFSINQPDILSLAITTTNQIDESTTGTAQIEISGGTPPYSILWDDNSTDIVNSNLQAGNHSVLVTDVLGCSSSLDFVILLLTDLNSPSQNKSTIYPNPANDIVLIHLNDFKQFSIKVFDSVGKLQLVNRNVTSPFNLAIDALQRGVYIIEIDSGDLITRHMFLKQ